MTDDMAVDSERLRDHVARLAASPRPAESEELRACRDYVADCLEAHGWSVGPHAFGMESEEGERLGGVNLIARLDERVDERLPWFCVAAHLDSRPDSPGADDNASAVAALLEIARLLPDSWPAPPRLNVELLVTDLEENGMLGGAEHVRLTRERNLDLQGMVSLEMLGYCSHEPRSQALPKSLVGQYPDTGNFIAVIGNQNSDTLIGRFRAGMQRAPGLPVESLAVPANGEYLQASRLSDHSPFWDAGYPALMITDTSFLRNPHYHLPSDTPETLDEEFLQKVGQGSFEAVRLLIETGLQAV